MKEVYFKTIKGDFIAVEIPDNKRYNLSRMAVRNDFYRIVCKLPEATEENASEVVDKENSFFGAPLSTNLEALYSLLQANDVYFENPIKHPKQMNMIPASVGWYNRQVQEYEKAQSKVWDKERTYLFKKI